MRIALISPINSKFKIRTSKINLLNFHIIRVSRISLLSLAAITPREFDIKIIDEQYDSIDFNEYYDLVGVSFTTDVAPRAYEIGDKFKRSGVKVVFGGFHPTLMPHEAVKHANSVCIGEGEINWPRIIKDAEQNKLKKFYKSSCSVDLKYLNPIPRNLFRKRDFFSSNLVFAGRGCNHFCEFCSVTHFFNHTYRHRDVDDIIEEIKGMNKNIIVFGDDNLIADREFALELFMAIQPLKKKWFAQVPITIGEDDKLLKTATDSGCIGLFIGLETLTDKNLINHKKNLLSAKHYSKALEKIYDQGIAVLGSFMFGFDYDHVNVFERTLNFAVENRLIASQIAILTPFPGTTLYKKLEETGRIIDRDWSKYDFKHVVFEPLHMTPDELKKGTDWFTGKFYSNYSIYKRLNRFIRYWGLKNNFFYALPFNIAYKQYFRREKN